ncbi:protease [Bdellovibrio sp.]|uniref:protease n=1 Tax=Bdellovibrio sp. TaxID=28201 RepID=UPI0039E34F7C
MTNIMKLAAAAMLFIAAQNANAISLRFKFKTFSSGPDIYACNAGLRHQATTHQACYFQDTQIACTPGTGAKDCSSGVCHTRCICTNNNGGEYLMDYMKGSYNTWNPAVQSQNSYTPAGWSNSWSATTKQAGAANYETLVGHTDAFATRIKELSFNLGSELYGAEYFVDICYRGPQIEYFADGVNARFGLLAQASATDFIANAVNPGDNHPDSNGYNNGQGGLSMNPATGPKYTSLAGLTVQAFTVCDLQGLGTYDFAHNGSTAGVGNYNTLLNEASFSNWNNPSEGGGDYFYASNAPLIGSAANLIDTTISTNTKTPRFCRIRYVFKETNGAAGSSALKNLRQWQRHGAEMCTYTKIEEAL